MTETLPEDIKPYPGISSKAYEHPADRAATAALKAVPMLDTVVRKLIEWGYERALRQSFLGNAVRVGENQLPDLWASHTGVCKILDMPEVYDLYVTWGVFGGAQAIGAGKPMVVIGSGLLEKLGPGEQRVVLAHEVGHILSDHMLYMTALNILVSVPMSMPFPVGLPLRAVRTVLLEWYRAAELSADRAATLAVRDPRIVCRTLMVLGGRHARPTSSTSTRSWPRPWSTRPGMTRATGSGASSTRSAAPTRYAVRRVSEVMKWVQSGEYDRIQRGEYRTRDQEANVREEAGDAVEFYAERFRAIFREMGENITTLGNQMGGVAEQVADWIRTRSGGSGRPTAAKTESRRPHSACTTRHARRRPPSVTNYARLHAHNSSRFRRRASRVELCARVSSYAPAPTTRRSHVPMRPR